VNPRIRQWRESLLGMFVGVDARAASNTPNGHLFMGEAAAGSGVSVNSSCQATRGDGNRSTSHDESYVEKQKGQGWRHAIAET
jgi:hypothetical protein